MQSVLFREWSLTVHQAMQCNGRGAEWHHTSWKISGGILDNILDYSPKWPFETSDHTRSVQTHAQYMIGTLHVQCCTRRTIGDNLSSAKLNLDQVMKHLQAIGNRLGETLTQS